MTTGVSVLINQRVDEHGEYPRKGDIQVHFSKAHFTKGEAWTHLLENPPTIRTQGKTWMPMGQDVRRLDQTHPLANGKKRKANPWKADHRPDTWCYIAAEQWVPGTIRRRAPKEPPPERLDRYALLMGEDG